MNTVSTQFKRKGHLEHLGFLWVNQNPFVDYLNYLDPSHLNQYILLNTTYVQSTMEDTRKYGTFNDTFLISNLQWISLSQKRKALTIYLGTQCIGCSLFLILPLIQSILSPKFNCYFSTYPFVSYFTALDRAFSRGEKGMGRRNTCKVVPPCARHCVIYFIFNVSFNLHINSLRRNQVTSFTLPFY